MNDYYVERWNKLRKIEGASQRVQEDTMRFASIMENLGVSFLDSIMTLIAFLPVLAALSVHVALQWHNTLKKLLDLWVQTHHLLFFQKKPN